MKTAAWVVALLGIAVTAQATTVNVNTTPGGITSIGGFSGATIINFESVAPGTYSSVTQSGVTFTPDGSNQIWVDNAYSGQYNNFGQSLHNNYDSLSFGTLTINFSSPTSAFGFHWGASDTQWTLNAYNASHVLIESFALPITGPGNAGTFVGLVDPGIASATLVGDAGDYIFVDNFAFQGNASSSVPEPSSLFLLGTGLAGVITLARKRLSSR